MKLLITTEQTAALVSLREALAPHRFVLIGAAALGCFIDLKRETFDVDLAVAVPAPDIPALLGAKGWSRDLKQAQRWHSVDGGVADLIPATNDLINHGAVQFNGGATSMSLVGFDLALSHSVEGTLPGGSTRIEVACLPALVILKIVAWLDRPQERGKDLSDLVQILEQALPGDDGRRWETDHAIGNSGLDYEDQSAFFVGQEVARIVPTGHAAEADVCRFLNAIEPIDSVGFAQMLQEMRHGYRAPAGVLTRRLTAFSQGLSPMLRAAS